MQLVGSSRVCSATMLHSHLICEPSNGRHLISSSDVTNILPSSSSSSSFSSYFSSPSSSSFSYTFSSSYSFCTYFSFLVLNYLCFHLSFFLISNFHFCVLTLTPSSSTASPLKMSPPPPNLPFPCKK